MLAISVQRLNIDRAFRRRFVVKCFFSNHSCNNFVVIKSQCSFIYELFRLETRKTLVHGVFKMGVHLITLTVLTLQVHVGVHVEQLKSWMYIYGICFDMNEMDSSMTDSCLL